MALSVLVVKLAAGMVTSNGDAGAAKVFDAEILEAPQQLASSPPVEKSAPRNTTIQIWYVAAVAPQPQAGLPLHVPLKMDVYTLVSGLEPAASIPMFHNCPAAALVVMEVEEGTIAETTKTIMSFACMPEGGVIDALVAVVIASSLAGTRDWPTTVIGGPPAAAERNVGVIGPPLVVKAEVALR
jgi:hypothetical protein